MLALLCAMFNFAWGQANKSTTYTSNVTLSTTGGTSASTCKVVIDEQQYDGIKAGTGSVAGACQISVPAGTLYLHLHAAGWKGETVKLSVTKSGDTQALKTIDLTADAGVSGNSPFTLVGDAADYYSVIEFDRVLTEATNIIISATQ